MQSFADILERAAARCGGMPEIEKELPQPKTTKQLTATSDAECLSLMSLRIFRAGLKHSMVDAKWPAFEEVFTGFDPARLHLLSDDDIDRFMQEKRIIRHLGKIKSVRANAQAIHDLQEEYDGVGAYLADWPINDIVGLWDDIKKRFSQLGGMSGPYFLRMVGKDTFLLTQDVIKALNQWSAVSGEVKSKQAKRQTQDAFNHWHDESGRPLSAISKILALSVD